MAYRRNVSWPIDCDVVGVRVGHTTLVKGDSIRTGVTAILPHDGNLFREKVPAAIFVGNGFGKLAVLLLFAPPPLFVLLTLLGLPLLLAPSSLRLAVHPRNFVGWALLRGRDAVSGL